ncbi:DUF1638 domain-containing protein [Primorskyibacter sp. S187A]|uniref:DUF1638 domain-containing protein n=1 Tax=Primorskyibacter sp. S187A TaxID=3415130 RepID=UPI003C7B1881
MKNNRSPRRRNTARAKTSASPSSRDGEVLIDDPTSDGEATHLVSHRNARTLLLACGALAREIRALMTQNAWTHLDLICLPAILHNHPARIAPAVRQALTTHQEAYDEVFVVYADCGTGGDLAKVCAEFGVEMVPGPHCYSFYEGTEAFDALEETTAFYLTDFLARQFDAFVWKPLGLEEHPELRDMYFGNYTKLVYQAQTDDPALTQKAQESADRLGLAFERRFTGYGDLAKALAGIAPPRDAS